MRAKLIAGIVKKFNTLPTNYYIGSTKINLEKATDVIKEQELFFTVQEATPTQYQSIEPLIPSDFNGTIWVERLRDWTQQEIENYKESQREALIDKRESDGRNAVKKLRTYVLKKLDEGIINENQVDNIHNGLIPVVEALKNADWKKAQKYFDPTNTDPYITYIDPPTNSDLLNIYNFIKDKIDAYVSANYSVETSNPSTFRKIFTWVKNLF